MTGDEGVRVEGDENDEGGKGGEGGEGIEGSEGHDGDEDGFSTLEEADLPEETEKTARETETETERETERDSAALVRLAEGPRAREKCVRAREEEVKIWILMTPMLC